MSWYRSGTSQESGQDYWKTTAALDFEGLSLQVSQIDKEMGIKAYVTESIGVGGIIRFAVEDFRVEEVLVDGSKATIEQGLTKPVLGATSLKQHFLLCVLVKWNWDTFMAIKNVAKALGIDQSRVHFAGIKDAKAVTAQHVAVEGVSAEAAAKVHIKDIELRPLGYFREPLSGYYLLGNNFGIRVRGISHSRTVTKQRVAKIMNEIATVGGIPNFYGHQRFGTTRAITHLVGKAIVKGDLEEAAMVFLGQPSVHEHPESRLVRGELQTTRDFKHALQSFPMQLRYERLMLAHLAEMPEDFAGAFRRLPLKLQLLFVQAYQSFLFNLFLSARILGGFPLCKAEVGDFVVNVERSGLPMVRTGRVVCSGEAVESNRLIKVGKLRVGLPIVGIRQKISQGKMGELQKRILEAEGVDGQNFKIAALPELSGRGELRAAVSPVNNFELGAVSSDVDKSRKSQVDLKFTLLKSSYATVLLREIMKPRNPISAGF
jgi:tRNA pseudouridine13 synthase